MRPWTPIAGHTDRTRRARFCFGRLVWSGPKPSGCASCSTNTGTFPFRRWAGFAPPLEPYANGVIGETLGMMWAAGMPASFVPSAVASTGAAAKTVAATGDAATEAALQQRADYREHVRAYALPARALFVAAGPNSPLRTGTDAESLRYLNGATTYLERVYGAPLLGRALQPLALRAQQTEASRRAAACCGRAVCSLRLTRPGNAPWNPDKTLPLWLPGALDAELDAATLVNRSAYTLRAGTRAAVWLWVPPGTAELRIEGAGAGALSALGTPFSAKGDVARVFFTGNGWQKFVLVAGKNATIGAARLIRK